MDPHSIVVVSLHSPKEKIWGELWQDLTRLQDETERFALDKRQAIVAGIGMLSGAV